ncbi:MAG TPA: pilin [Rhodanobacteraceae bacterium]
MHSVTKSMQQGFTLIELMIVVAIIAILAAIAIPQYEHYIARSQFSEALTVTAGLKTDLINYWDQNGAFPASGSTAPLNLEANALSGKYVASVAITSPSIVVTFRPTGVSSALQGKTVDLTPVINVAGSTAPKTLASVATGTDVSGAISWVCSTEIATASAADVPSSCRTASAP